MNEQEQATALARWLDAGGEGPPPEGVDADALEAIWALRPDLAPAPRLTADDILAGVAEGPLAEASGDDDAVVPFPVPASVPADDPSPERTRWTGGALVGLLAAAAAAVIVLPNAWQEADEITAVEAPVPTPATSSEPAPSAEQAQADVDADDEAATRRTTRDLLRRQRVEKRVRSSEKGEAVRLTAEPEAPAPDDRTAKPAREVPPAVPEAELQRAGDVQGAAPPPAERAPSAPARPSAGLADEEQAAKTAPPSDAPASDAPDAPAYADDDAYNLYPPHLEPDVADGRAEEMDLEGLDEAAPEDPRAQALARAAAVAERDPIQAARLLERWIRPPGAQGQAVARVAARYALDGGSPTLARRLVEAGLALEGTADDRQALEALATEARGGK